MTPEEMIQKVYDWQTAEFVPEMTCSKDPSHGALVPELTHELVVPVMLVCPAENCNFMQLIPSSVLEWDKEAALANLPERFRRKIKV